MFEVTADELGILTLSLKVALVSVIASLPVAIVVALGLARLNFPGKTLVDAIVHLPLVLPPVVVGFALLVLAVSVVSLPMLVDCNIEAGTALDTSMRAFRANFGLMIRWGLIVAVLLVLGSIPLFIGLAVVLPWLGYATWHLYTRLVDRSELDICKE